MCSLDIIIFIFGRKSGTCLGKETVCLEGGNDFAVKIANE
jgi:hypothetical protein